MFKREGFIYMGKEDISALYSLSTENRNKRETTRELTTSWAQVKRFCGDMDVFSRVMRGNFPDDGHMLRESGMIPIGRIDLERTELPTFAKDLFAGILKGKRTVKLAVISMRPSDGENSVRISGVDTGDWGTTWVDVKTDNKQSSIEIKVGAIDKMIGIPTVVHARNRLYTEILSPGTGLEKSQRILVAASQILNFAVSQVVTYAHGPLV
jgi:hypothetical protein